MYKLGDRVRYKEGSPDDFGTIVDINIYKGKIFYTVKWDHSNNEDEVIDEFKPHQLESIKH